MNDTSRRSSQVSFNDAELDSFTNVDDIFKKLNISQIQQLTKKYKSVIDSTKNDLHNLVGSKYRDLIKIAEDIDDIYQTSNDIDSRIQQLSYKPTKFGSIYLDNYGKFDSYCRKQNTLTTKKETRAIVVRNVINKKLNKLDQKIRLGSSPLVHTSNFIYYSKVYYTIETLFKDIIEKDESIRLYFFQLKSNLNDYLELELSRYNLPESIVHANDKFRPSQRLNTNDLVMNNSQILLQDDFDIDYEVDDDELDDGNDDDKEANNAFEVDEIVNSKLESYDKNTLVICNYLISYTILNGGKAPVASKFIELRMAYIDSLLNDLPTKSPLDQVNFYQIFKFLEHTCNYVDSYFEKTSSDYHRILTHVTKPWNATTLIGHKVWIEDELIQFAADSTTTFDRATKFTELIKLVFDFTIKSLPQDNIKFENLTLTVFVFHNFLVSLKRLQDSVELSGLDSKFIAVMSKTNLLNDLLVKVGSFINSSYVKHATRLTLGNEKSIAQLMEQTLQSDLNQISSYQLFTPDLVNLMDVNTERYIQILSGENPVQDGSNALVELTGWFKEYEKYNRIVKIETEDSRGSKLDAFKCVSHLHTYLQNVSWGDFKVEEFDNEFRKLSTTMNDLFWDQISKFLEFISKVSESVTTTDKIVYIIGITNQLKEKISTMETTDTFKSTNESIDNLSIQLFKRLINDIPNEEILKLLENSIIESIELEGNDIPTRPNLKLTAMIYKLANEYLKVSEISNNLDIFLNSKISRCFIDTKNNWFKDELIGKKFIMNLETTLDAKKEKNHDLESGKVDDSNEEEVKDVPEQEAEKDSKENSEEDSKVESEEPKEDVNGSESELKDEEKNDEQESQPDDDIKPKGDNSEVINGSSTISKTQALAILANYTFLLHFFTSKVELDDTNTIIELIKQHYNGDIEKSTLTIVVDGVASFYRSHKNIYLPLLVLE